MKTQVSWVLGLVCLGILGTCGLAQDLPVEPINVGESLRISSKALNQTRALRVYLPVGYSKSLRRYPVIYALDGEGTGPIAASAVRFMTSYPAIPMMPEAIVVGAINADRNRDMPIPAEYGKAGERRFLQFLTDEAIPLIEQRYRTQPLKVLIGHSQGGLFAVYALIERPDSFQWCLSMDAPLAGFAGIRVHHAELVDEDTFEGLTEDVAFIRNKPAVPFSFRRVRNPDRLSQRPGPGSPRDDLAVGTPAPDWQLKTVDGQNFRLSDLRGRVVVLDFWANWCGPCRKLMPLFDELVNEYRQKQVEFFTVSIWPEEFDPVSFLREQKMSSTFLIGDDAVAKAYRIWGLPTYFVIDPAGNISYVHVLLSTEPEPLRRRLKQAIERSLG